MSCYLSISSLYHENDYARKNDGEVQMRNDGLKKHE